MKPRGGSRAASVAVRESRSAFPRRSAQPGRRRIRLGDCASVGLMPFVSASSPASFSLLAVGSSPTCTHRIVRCVRSASAFCAHPQELLLIPAFEQPSRAFHSSRVGNGTWCGVGHAPCAHPALQSLPLRSLSRFQRSANSDSTRRRTASRSQCARLFNGSSLQERWILVSSRG